MKLSELMTDITPSPEFAGYATNDDFVLAVNTAGNSGAGTPGNFTVVQVGVTSHEASLETETDEKQYIRTGKVTTKTGTQRTFSISGDRYHGDAFQDWAMSLPVMFGHGASVVVEYVYFSILTGKGEQGKVSVVVQEDQTGDAGENAGFSVDLMGQGNPKEYTYAASFAAAGLAATRMAATAVSVK